MVESLSGLARLRNTHMRCCFGKVSLACSWLRATRRGTGHNLMPSWRETLQGGVHCACTTRIHRLAGRCPNARQGQMEQVVRVSALCGSGLLSHKSWAFNELASASAMPRDREIVRVTRPRVVLLEVYAVLRSSFRP